MKQISFNNERKLHHITKYYTHFRKPYFLMNSLINLIHTMCIIWSRNVSGSDLTTLLLAVYFNESHIRTTRPLCKLHRPTAVILIPWPN